MKITLFTTDANCTELGMFKAAHITIFEKNEMSITFVDESEQLSFIQCCIKNYVLIKVQGASVKIVPETNNFQRVRFRFDSK